MDVLRPAPGGPLAADHPAGDAPPEGVPHSTVEYVGLDVAAAHHDLSMLRTDVLEAGRDLIAAARDGRAGDALIASSNHRVLCAHR